MKEISSASGGSGSDGGPEGTERAVASPAPEADPRADNSLSKSAPTTEKVDSTMYEQTQDLTPPDNFEDLYSEAQEQLFEEQKQTSKSNKSFLNKKG